MYRFIIIFSCFAAIPCAVLAQDATPKQHSVTFVDRAGKAIGKAELTQGAKGILLHVQASGLEPGMHGLHFHRTGICDGTAAFESAGEHIGPDAESVHGYLAPGATHHAGDLPNLVVTPQGTADAQYFISTLALEEKVALPALMDSDGAALIVHANADDYKTPTSGNAGDRIACAIIPPRDK